MASLIRRFRSSGYLLTISVWIAAAVIISEASVISDSGASGMLILFFFAGFSSSGSRISSSLWNSLRLSIARFEALFLRELCVFVFAVLRL